MDLSAFYNQFREETQENIRVLSEVLLELEQAGPEYAGRRASLDRVFRAVHTVKGSARMLGFETVGKLAHAMENLLGALRQGEQVLDSALADQLLRGGDMILELTAAAVENREPAVNPAGLLAELAAVPGVVPVPPAALPATLEPAASPAPLPAVTTAPAPATASATQSARTAARQTVRVRVDRLDRLINLAGELVVGQQFLSDHVNRLGKLYGLVGQQEQIIKALAGELARLRFSHSQRQMIDNHLGRLSDAGDHLQHMINQINEQFDRYLGQQGMMVDDLEREVLAARMVPIATLFSSIPRAVRDLSQTTGKQVALELSGETTELDRKLLELLSDPILHLVRNAVDHGIEPPHERAAAGKAASGRLRIAAETIGGEVRIAISDDGRGMDPAVLRSIAIRRGLINSEQARTLNDTESLELIFIPGFSTASAVSEISGRGVGMDVVRSNITDLGGLVAIESQVGQGTTITLSLPLTLITTRIVLVRLGRALFALPASGCKGTIWVYQDQVYTVKGQATVEQGGRTLPLVHLADLIGLNFEPSARRTMRTPALVIGGGGRLLVALVDDLVDEREVVVKPLGPFFDRQRIYSGAIQLGDGSLVLLLNPVQLARQNGTAAALRPATVTAVQTSRWRVLVTDDSFTTRELIKSILSSAGYDVTAAVDGQDALDKLRAGPYDLVVSDVEMPRVDGFQLTSRIRRELGFADLPVILITSLSSEAHRRQGLEAGAQAYIVKSQFNQDSLLEVIQQLLGHEE